MGRSVTPENNMRVMRPDIAHYMDLYNQYYGCSSNVPEQTSTYGTAMVYCRCEHGHDFHQKANKISQWIQDDKGVIYCPECHELGFRRKGIKRREHWNTSLYDYCHQAADKLYILQEWDYEKNNQLHITPKTIGFGSNRKVWWRCPNGHSYDMDISNRNEGSSCPICSGRRLLPGYNDLASQYPDVALDWDYDNNDKKPNEVTQHSSKKAYWKCHICGYKWVATISHRTSKSRPSGCPKCINHGMSRAEMCVYLSVKKYYPDAEYRKKLFGSEFDIFVPSINMAIEYDGEYFHNNAVKQSKDESKTLLTKENNVQFLRVKEVRNVGFDFQYDDGVLLINVNRNTNYKEISRQVLICLNEQFDINIGINVDDDIVQQAISQIKSQNYENSLLNKFPEVAKEWHPTKNGDLKPECLDAHAHVDAWWICSKCKNEFFKPIHRRTYIHAHSAGGCPYCCGQKRLVGFNDFETLFPGISKYWCVEENEAIGMKLEECAPRSIKYTYWNFGNGPQLMQTRNAVTRYKKLHKNTDAE